MMIVIIIVMIITTTVIILVMMIRALKINNFNVNNNISLNNSLLRSSSNCPVVQYNQSSTTLIFHPTVRLRGRLYNAPPPCGHQAL